MLTTQTNKEFAVHVLSNWWSNNLRTVPLSSTTLLSVPIGLWNCQSAVNKADFIPSIATHSGLNLMALTETWIKPEDTATPAALSTNFTFSHTPRTIGRGGGTGLLISNEWKFELLPSPTGNSSLNLMQLLLPTLLNPHCSCVSSPRSTGWLPGGVGCATLKLPEDGTPLVLPRWLQHPPRKTPGYWLQHSSHFIWPQTSVYYGYSQIR